MSAMTSVDGLLRWIKRCNTETYTQNLLPLTCATRHVGYCKPSFAEQLARFPNVFKVTNQHVNVLDELSSPADRTNAIADVMATFQAEGLITGWRGELYPVTESFHADPLFLLERAAAIPFGIRSYGVHMNGYVRTQGGIQLWVAKRAKNKPTWPGKLDHICAGGQPHGISPSANMVKECAEEASIPEHLARQAVPAGAVSYAQLQEQGLKRDCLFVYDLHLPPGFQPTPGDGEVEEFKLIHIDEVANIISASDDFKDNVNVVILDFMIRHGVLRPEMPGYLKLVSGLRQQDCS